MRRGSQRRHPLEAGQARDAIGPLGLERRRRWIVLVAAEIGPGVEVAAMAVFDGGCRDGRERCRGARRRATGQELVSVSVQFCESSRSFTHQTTYGVSEGVSGLGSGGGRFVRVGCEACAIAVSDMMDDLSCDVLRFATVNGEVGDSR